MISWKNIFEKAAVLKLITEEDDFNIALRDYMTVSQNCSNILLTVVETVTVATGLLLICYYSFESHKNGFQEHSCTATLETGVGQLYLCLRPELSNFEGAI